MTAATKIQWTDATWNPVTGCSKVSAGCANCYAERLAPRVFAGQRVSALGPSGVPEGHRQRRFTDVRCHPDRLDQPLRWRKPRRVFVNSMSDLFHEDVPDEFIDRVFAVMALSSRHTFQVLTKRPERMRRYFVDRASRHIWATAASEFAGEVSGFGCHQDVCQGSYPLPNIWLGVSCENQKTADERIPILLDTPAAVRFVSAEPLLGSIDLGLQSATCDCCARWSSRWVNLRGAVRGDFPAGDLTALAGIHRAHSNRHGALSIRMASGRHLGIKPREFDALPGLDWAIVGGESGPKARACDVAWIRSIVEQCREAGVPCFVKQLGAAPYEDDHDLGRFTPNVEERLLDPKGGNIEEWPEDLRVREFPGGDA